MIMQTIFFRFILPICLPPSNLQYTGKKGFVTGWGREFDGGPKPAFLNEVDIPILSNSECNWQLEALNEHVSEDIWVCAGYEEGGKDACDVGIKYLCKQSQILDVTG